MQLFVLNINFWATTIKDTQKQQKIPLNFHRLNEKKLTLTIIFNICLFYKQKKGIIKIFSNISNNKWREDSNIFLKIVDKKSSIRQFESTDGFLGLFDCELCMAGRKGSSTDRPVRVETSWLLMVDCENVGFNPLNVGLSDERVTSDMMLCAKKVLMNQ
jgi:hypothetical protein